MAHQATQRDVALKAGVNRSTVSRALNSDPRIPLKTREHILQIAREMDYRPNVSSQALIKQRHQGGIVQETIACISLRDTNDDPEVRARYDRFDRHNITALKAAAEKYNLNLELHHVGNRDEIKVLNHTLYHRGIRGVIFASILHPWPFEAFNWDQFIPICFFANFAPPSNRISSDWFQGMMNSYEHTYGRGYRKVAYVLFTHDDLIHDDQIRLAALHYLALEKVGDSIPIFRMSLSEYRRLMAGELIMIQQFSQWLERCQPDAIIGTNPGLHDILTQQLNLRIPQDIGYAQLIGSSPNDPLDLSGNIDNVYDLADSTFKVLIQQLHANAYGLPHHYIDIKLPLRWHTGSTLPPLA